MTSEDEKDNKERVIELLSTTGSAMSQKHTPGEWKPGPRGLGVIAVQTGQNPVTVVESLRTPSIYAKADIERICRCCNAHDDLVDALRAMLEDSVSGQPSTQTWLDAKKALAKAGEK